MTSRTQQLLREALPLPAEERADVAAELLVSLDEAESDMQDVETAWAAEIEGTAMAAATMRMTRTMTLEVLRRDYVRTAWSKGLKERAVVVRHAVKNAIIPVITLVGLQLPILVGGSVIMENIFDLPGLGRLMLNALEDRDYTVVSGIN